MKAHGSTGQDIAAEQAEDFDTLIDVVREDELRTVRPDPPDDDAASWFQTRPGERTHAPG